MSTAAETIIKQLAVWDIDSIYGVAGDTILPLLDALAAQKQVNFYSTKHETKHESSAGFMASAYTKLNGQPGFCLVHVGPIRTL